MMKSYIGEYMTFALRKHLIPEGNNMIEWMIVTGQD